MSSTKKLSEKVNQISQQKLMVIGDIGLDEYVNGTVKRISPEAPVPVLDANKEEVRLGLSGNVAQNIASLKGEVCFISVLGDDEVGKRVCSLLEKEGVSANGFVKDSSRPTTRKLRVMTGHHHIVRVDYEQRCFISEEVTEKLIEKVKAEISSCSGVILQDYAKGVLSEKVIQEVITLAQKEDIPVFVDPHRTTPLSYYRGATVFKPNFDESLALSQMNEESLSQSGDIVDIMGEKLQKELSCQHLILTRGSKGMSIFSQGQRQDIPTAARQVFDVTGAGDTVIATLALAFCSGMDLSESGQIANAAAGIVVSKIGCVPCSFEELKSELEKSS